MLAPGLRLDNLLIAGGTWLMASIRIPRSPRTAAEALRALRLPDLEALLGGPRDCRVWESVHLGRDGRVLLVPLRLAAPGTPPGYAACLRRLPRLLRLEGFPAVLADRGSVRLRAGKFRSL